MGGQTARPRPHPCRPQQIRHERRGAYIKRKYRVANLPDTFETGGIVGMAVITDCVKSHRSKWFQGPFGWTLASARRLPFKPAKGQLKFFTPDI